MSSGDAGDLSTGNVVHARIRAALDALQASLQVLRDRGQQVTVEAIEEDGVVRVQVSVTVHPATRPDAVPPARARNGEHE